MQEALLEKKKRDGYWTNIIGGGGVASGATLVTFAHPFIGAAVGLAGLLALISSNLPGFKLPAFNPLQMFSGAE